MIQRAFRQIARGFEILIVTCLAIMGLLVFGNVVLRYAFNSGIAVSEELARLLFVWLIFMGAVLASARRIHIGFDSLQRAVGPGVRRMLVVFTGVLILAGCGIFIVGGWRQTLINLGNTYPVLGISYAWLYGTALVFGVALIFPVCNNIYRALVGIDDALTEDLADRIEGRADRMGPSKPASGGGASTKQEDRP
ncbi:MAG: TRAP transporter small permease [Castellaniella sp.]|uniref:TRAP transporter small permease n=1 Tax=Castellaniella sp. TaxID=1955812 RepID=UPI002A35A99F|nr:TRAP transporter small permease [Castellaniella sp.]MDY0310000.1 TRAP transporter small permease [Castellaniella sp.]